MRPSGTLNIGLAIGVGLSILSGLCFADELPGSGAAQPSAVDPYAGQLPPQNPPMPFPGGVPPQSGPNVPLGMGQQQGCHPLVMKNSRPRQELISARYSDS